MARAGAVLLDWLWSGFCTRLRSLHCRPSTELATNSCSVLLAATAIDRFSWNMARAGLALLNWLWLGFFTWLRSLHSWPLVEWLVSELFELSSATNAIRIFMPTPFRTQHSPGETTPIV